MFDVTPFLLILTYKQSRFSGITEAMLAPVRTTLPDIQQKLLKILNPRTVLIGHSLNADLTALKLTHPFVIDTALLYPHPRGPPLKSSLKWLAQRYLTREIQRGHGTTGPGAGHDSIEDARACLDLLKQKCEKGPQWGENESTGENLFRRLAKSASNHKLQNSSAVLEGEWAGKSSAAIDWGDPRKGAGSAANVVIGCKSDDDVVKGVIRAVKGDPDGLEVRGGGVDFVWARLRELESLKGWWNNNKLLAAEESTIKPSIIKPALATEKEAIGGADEEVVLHDKSVVLDATPPSNAISLSEQSLNASRLAPPELPALTPSALEIATSALSSRIHAIYESLPPCTAFIIYSGSGDPREMSRLQAMQTTFKREFRIKKWDQLSVKWSDLEEQALRKAVREARDGIGFITVK